jgi:hypothetical protein
LAHASYPESARAKARAISQRPCPIPKVAVYCAATWLCFPPPLTHIAGTQWSTRKYMNMAPLHQAQNEDYGAAIA